MISPTLNRIIAILRIIGILFFIAFIVIAIIKNDPSAYPANIFAAISAGIFLIIVLIQLYKHYIRYYLNREEGS